MNLYIKLIFAFIILTQNGCKTSQDECSNPNAITRIHDFNLEYYPHIMVYKEYDTIRLLKNSIDTVLFIGDKIRQLEDIIPAKSGCGKESFKIAIQNFKSLTGDSIVLYYSMMLNYSLDIDQFTVEYNETNFNQFPEYIVNCDPSTSTITVLGKSYCALKIPSNGGGLPYIYYSKDYGLIQLAINQDIYERIPD